MIGWRGRRLGGEGGARQGKARSRVGWLGYKRVASPVPRPALSPPCRAGLERAANVFEVNVGFVPTEIQALFYRYDGISLFTSICAALSYFLALILHSTFSISSSCLSIIPSFLSCSVWCAAFSYFFLSHYYFKHALSKHLSFPQFLQPFINIYLPIFQSYLFLFLGTSASHSNPSSSTATAFP